MLNRVILIGRLTRDPELRYTPNGAAVCKFTWQLTVNSTERKPTLSISWSGRN